jgi:hypothetical protein
LNTLHRMARRAHDSIAPVLRMLRKAYPWAMAAWAVRNKWANDPMHPDLPAKVIEERQLRPWG